MTHHALPCRGCEEEEEDDDDEEEEDEEEGSYLIKGGDICSTACLSLSRMPALSNGCCRYWVCGVLAGFRG